jgi:glycosyltransferase involved in cell wall biosynthesis
VQGHYDFGSDALIALTETMRQNIIKSGKSEETVFTVPNMIALPEPFLFKPPRKKTKPVIGVCARFAAIKGIDIFIEALAELKRRKVDFEAKIAGDGTEKDHYLQLIHKYQLQQTVHLLGWIEDKDPFYESLDIFCLPSREEAFGLVILEAMKHALPMVLTNLSGPQEIISDSQSALLVSPENPIEMADALERIIKEEALAQNLAKNAFERIQNFSSQAVGPKLHRVLEEVCKNFSTD